MNETTYPLTPIPNLLARSIETALDQVLALDPETVKRIEALEGRRVGLDLKGTGLSFVLQAAEGRLEVRAQRVDGSDLSLRAGAASLLAMAMPWQRDGALPAGRLEIAGDAELGRRIEELVRRADPDWDEPLARLFGDVLGAQLARFLRRGWQWSRESAHSLLQTTAEYLREESRDLVAVPELEQFLDQVDEVRERAERLQARWARLQGAARS